MIYDYDIIQVSEDERDSILKFSNVSLKEFIEMVEILERWLLQSSLPKEDNARKKIEIFLFNTKYNIEKSKRCIENYYRLRTEHSKYFEKMIPNTKLYNEAKKMSRPIILQKLTPDFCRIIMFRLEKYQELQCDGEYFQLLNLMAVEVILSKGDFYHSHILIIDNSFFELKHLIKYTPTVAAFFMKLLLALSLRLKNIHVVNPSPVIDKILTFFKLFLPTKFHNKIVIHSNYESLYAFIPKDYLPLDYGGKQQSIEEVQDKWCEEIEKSEELFKQLLDVKYQFTKTTDNPVYGNFGIDGSFRKLAVD